MFGAIPKSGIAALTSSMIGDLEESVLDGAARSKEPAQRQCGTHSEEEKYSHGDMAAVASLHLMRG